jgi:hypothetical protein
VDAFVAHDTIEPTREWRDVLEAALLSCDALCAILTPDFLSSPWCDQEVGFAIARRVVVVPLTVGTVPHGFMNTYQGLNVDSGAVAREVAENLFEALAKSPETMAAIADRAEHPGRPDVLGCALWVSHRLVAVGAVDWQSRGRGDAPRRPGGVRAHTASDRDDPPDP